MANIRLHGSDMLPALQLNKDLIQTADDDMDLQYEVDRDYLWTSCFSMFSNQHLCDKMNPKYHNDTNRIYKMDYEKNMEAYISQNPMDYLVLDLWYTYQIPVAVLEGEVYTFNKALRQSEFYIDHKREFEIYEFKEMTEEQWKGYLDRYIQVISKYYDKDHIILVRMNYAKDYIDSEGVHTWEREDVEENNKNLRKLEDYFIEKTDCYRIDLARYYKVVFNPKKGLLEYGYEKEFFKFTRTFIYKIIDTKPEQRSFDTEPYSKLLSNYVSHYEEGNIPDENGFLLHEDDLVDSIVLTMSKQCIERYWNDFSKMKEMAPESIEEILKKYDFWCSIDLKDMLKTMTALDKGELFREKTNYSSVVKFHNRYEAQFLKMVKKVFEQLEPSIAENISLENVSGYYDILVAFRKEDRREWKHFMKQLEKKQPAILDKRSIRKLKQLKKEGRKIS